MNKVRKLKSFERKPEVVFQNSRNLDFLGKYNFRIDPPLELATHIRNETTCLFELINPFPSKNLNKDTGLSAFCDEVGFFRLTKKFLFILQNKWPTKYTIYYGAYRTAVFFWILVGLAWLGGVVSILKDTITVGVRRAGFFQIYF